jgi:DNA polymerase (family 10)
MLLSEGIKQAEILIDLLAPYCERIEVAGSIRRKKPTVHDIDLVLIPKPLTDIVGMLRRTVMADVLKQGPRIVNLKIHDIGVDLNYASSSNFEAVLLFRTGPWEHNERLARKAKRMGLSFSIYGVYKKGTRIDNGTEEGIFEALNEAYRAPEER